MDPLDPTSDLTAFVPLAAALLLGLARWRLHVGPTRVPWWAELVGWPVFVAGIVVAAAVWFAPFTLIGGPWVTSDFADYCSMVGAAAAGDRLPESSRSVAVARLVAWLGRGAPVFDTLVRGAWVGSLLVVGGIVGWARMVAGRGAGIYAGLAFLGVAPLVLLTRTPTFYPLMDGSFALGAAAAAWALTRGTLPAVVATAAAAGVCGLADARGIGWAGPYAVIAVATALSPAVGRPWRAGSTLVRVGLVVLVLGGAWAKGRELQARSSCPTLESQTFGIVGGVTAGLVDPPVQPPASCNRAHGYCWGWWDPRDAPGTARCLSDIRALVPADFDRRSPSLVAQRTSAILPWGPAAAGFSAVALLGLVRRPRRLLALIVPALPFLAGLPIAWFLEPDIRRIAPILVPLPVFASVATACLLGRGSEEAAQGSVGRPRRYGALFAAGCAVVWLVAVVGRPGWWSPVAPWRTPTAANLEYQGFLDARLPPGGAGRKECAAVLRSGPQDLSFRGVVGRETGVVLPARW